ncbi:MAG: hypothetical protein CVU64_07395 [Deltaproteobacteria bacterium HGW-Deltaproteobacteria-21]|jgi:hypothetical protein|nr:MAG: hypothetical protein CVU64_07395 [Deltaproteobacteria bacterium HGW-Deltaproteobacteria-21]
MRLPFLPVARYSLKDVFTIAYGRLSYYQIAAAATEDSDQSAHAVQEYLYSIGTIGVFLDAKIKGLIESK